MATIVGAFGVPHMPTSPGDCAANPESLVARGFAAVRGHVDDIDPDALHRVRHRPLPSLVLRPTARVRRRRRGRTDGPGTDDWPGEARFAEIPVDEPLAGTSTRGASPRPSTSPLARSSRSITRSPCPFTSSPRATAWSCGRSCRCGSTGSPRRFRSRPRCSRSGRDGAAAVSAYLPDIGSDRRQRSDQR